MARTIPAGKKQRIPRRTIFWAPQTIGETLYTPTYAVGDVIRKGRGPRLLIIKDNVSWDFDRQIFTLMNLDTNVIIEDYIEHPTRIMLGIFGYFIDSQWERDDAADVVRQASNYHSHFRIKREAKDVDFTGYCEGGERIPMSKCEIVEGEDPSQDRRVKIKGKTVVGTKAKCCHCGRKMQVKLIGGKFVLERHLAIKGKRKPEKQKSRRTK